MTALLLFFLALTAPQALPHGIPDLCATEPIKTIIPAGTTTPLSGAHNCVEVRGAATVTGTLRVVTILVYPGGSLTFADGSETVFFSAPIDAVNDPEQWGHGLIVVDGLVRAAGAAKTPFVRLGAAVSVGATTLTLASPVAGWNIGDVVFLPDTRHVNDSNWFNPNYAVQHERIAIASVSPDGRSVTLATPTQFAHAAGRNADGTTFAFPHVANLTRSIKWRSETANGVRAHVAFVGRSDVDVRGVEISDMGRTTTAFLASAVGATPGANQIGRYPLHVHMLNGPVNPSNTGYQFTLQGNVVRDSLKWPIAIHNSHFGLVKDNVVIGGTRLAGAGIALEDGSETENLITRNFIGDIRGNFNPRQTGPSPIGSNLNGTCPGCGADGLWAAGFNNRFTENVVTGARNLSQQVASGAGFKFSAVNVANAARMPLTRGADCSVPAACATVNPRTQPIREFANNEVYGLSATGVTIWYLGTDGYSTPWAFPVSRLVNLTCWNTYDGCAWLYPVASLSIEGMQYRAADIGGASHTVSAVVSGDYRDLNLTVKNSSIEAGGGLFSSYNTDPLGSFLFENNQVVSRSAAYKFETPKTPGTGAVRPAQGATAGSPTIAMMIRGGRVLAWPGTVLKTIAMIDTPTGNKTHAYLVDVQDYQGVVGDNFRVYFAVQATQNLYGGLAPCSTTRPEIAGLVCVPAPPPPPNPCVTNPLVITGINWPAAQTGSRSGSWNSGPFVLVEASFVWTSVLTFRAVDNRGCVFSQAK